MQEAWVQSLVGKLHSHVQEKKKKNKTESFLKMLYSFLKKLHIELPCDLAIPHLGIYPRELKTCSHKTWAWIFIAALFIIAKM